MSDDPPLQDRLARMQRLKAKMDGGEALTESEAEQYMADARAVKENMESALDPLVEAVGDFVGQMSEAASPIAELAAEYEVPDDA